MVATRKFRVYSTGDARSKIECLCIEAELSLYHSTTITGRLLDLVKLSII